MRSRGGFSSILGEEMRLRLALAAITCVSVASVPMFILRNVGETFSVKGDLLARPVAGEYALAKVMTKGDTTFVMEGRLLIPSTKVRTIIFRNDGKMIVGN